MELASGLPRARGCCATVFVPVSSKWKTAHPSEEGEALQRLAANAIFVADPVAPSLAKSLQSSSWFALYTASRHEKRVAEHLGQREIECFLPLYSSKRKWSDGSRVTLELPLRCQTLRSTHFGPRCGCALCLPIPGLLPASECAFAPERWKALKASWSGTRTAPA